MMNNILEAKNLYKSYGKKEQKVEVLNDVSFAVTQGKKVVFTGESGSGKTTLLSVLSGLDTIDSGHIIIGDTVLSKAHEVARAKFRLMHIGFIFQYHYLLQDFTALKNIMLPLIMLGVPTREAKKRAQDMLERIGIAHRAHHLPSQMSGGECQRTAIARALIHKPLLVLADEPTGALDEKNSENIRELLKELVQEQNSTLLIATHDSDFLPLADTHWHFTHNTIEKKL